MNPLLLTIGSILLLILLCLIWWHYRSEQANRKLLRGLFIEEKQPPEEVKAFIEALFPKHHLLPPHYRGSEESIWKRESWLLTVALLRDDLPPLTVLTWEQKGSSLPDFVISPTRGITRTDGFLANFSGVGGRWRHLGLSPLPDTEQPFLSKERGLVLYATQGERLIEKFPPHIFDLLRDSETGLSLAHLGERIACWTQQMTISELLEVSEAIKAALPGTPFP